MYLIGTNHLKLKIWRVIPAIFCILCWAISAEAFERELLPEEVAKLESNAKSDPRNVIARRFLIEHYSKEEKWLKVNEFSAGIYSELPAATLLKVASACIQNFDGPGAIAALGAFHGKSSATPASKTMEGLALATIAMKNYKDADRKQRAITALDVFKEAIVQWPKEPAPYKGWIATLNDIWPDNVEDRIQVYKKLENATGDFETYLVEKCELFVKARFWDQALVGCQRAIKKHPGNIDCLVNLARAQKVRYDMETAMETLTKAIQSDPNSVIAHVIYAEFAMEQNNYISAAEHYRVAISLDKNNTFAYLGLAKAEFQLKKYEEALVAYKNNCRLSRTVASEFRSAEGKLRIENNPLHIQYKNVMSSCR